LDFWFTGEVFGQSIYDGKNYYFNNGFDNIINFAFKGDLEGKSQEAIFSDYANRINNENGFNVLSYISSHDVSPYNRGNLYYAGTTLLLAPGGVQIFYGDESGRPYFSPQTYGDAGYRSFMNWNDIENNSNTQNLLGHWQKLGKFRREHLSVGAGSHQKLNDNPYIFRRSYNKNGVEDKTLVAMNVPENSSPYTLNVYGTYSDGNLLKDYFSGATATVSSGQATFQTSFGMLLVGIPFDTNQQTVSLSVSPASGNYPDNINVSMSASTTASGASVSIYYTLDGSDPDQNDSQYSGSFNIGSSTSSPITLKARAFDSEGNVSPLVTNNYTFGDPDGFTVHFKNTNNWNNVSIYLFDKNANAPLAGWTWPGTPMSQEGTSPWYKYTIDESVEVGIVINNTSGQQTDDLFRTIDGWYDFSNNTWYNTCPGDCPAGDPVPVLSVNPAGGTYSNSVNVSLSATNGGDIYYTTDGSSPNNNSTSYNNSLTFTTTTNLKAIAYNTTGSSNVIDETYTFTTTNAYDVHFKNTSNWNDVYIYLYNKGTGGQLAGWNWPGQPMSQEQSSEWYVYTIDESVEVGIVFNNNNNGQQTGNLFRTSNGWYDHSNNTWYNSCPGDCPEETPDGITLHYNNNSTNWNNVTLYYWSTTPTSISTSWPGVQMTDPDNDGWYSYTLNGVECANVIFSNNGNSQTGDLKYLWRWLL